MITIAPKVFIQQPPSSDEEKAFREYITALGRVCRTETFHGEYSAKYEFMAEPSKDDNENSSVRMDVLIDHVYLWYKIRVYPDVFYLYQQGDFKSIAAAVMHETCHLFTEPIAKLFMWDASASQVEHYRDTIERQTERICNAVMYAMPKEWYMPDAIMKHEANK